METPLHFRKVMLIGGGMGEQESARRALAPLGANSPMSGMISDRLVFWLPLPPGHPKRTRDAGRSSVVPDVRDFELRAIQDGAIEEVVMENRIPKDLDDAMRARAANTAWENLVRHRMGAVHAHATGAPLVVTPEAAAREQRRRGS